MTPETTDARPSTPSGGDAHESTPSHGRSGHPWYVIALVAIALVAIVVPLALVGMVVVARTGSTSPAATPSSDGGTTVPAMPSTVAATPTAPSTSGSPIPAAVPAAPAPVPAAPAAPLASPMVVGASATSMRAAGADACGNTTTYEPAKAVDGQPSTAWIVVGDGIGQTITLQLASPAAVRRVGLVAGYDKFDPCTGRDRFSEVRRLTAVRWTFDDGRQVDQLLNGSRRLQEIDLGADVLTSTVRITILSTTAHGGRDMAAISELAVR